MGSSDWENGRATDDRRSSPKSARLTDIPREKSSKALQRLGIGAHERIRDQFPELEHRVAERIDGDRDHTTDCKCHEHILNGRRTAFTRDKRLNFCHSTRPAPILGLLTIATSSSFGFPKD